MSKWTCQKCGKDCRENADLCLSCAMGKSELASMPGSLHLCDWCAECLTKNTLHGMESKIHEPCDDPKCAGGRLIRGVIVLDGDRSKLMKRIEALIEDAGNTQVQGTAD